MTFTIIDEGKSLLTLTQTATESWQVSASLFNQTDTIKTKTK